MVEQDAAYFERRAAEEMLAAELATTAEAALAHRELARRYSRMAGCTTATKVVPLDRAQV